MSANLKVINHSTGDSWHDGEEYGAWESHSNNSIAGISLVKDKDYWDVIADFDVKRGDIVYLVFVEYSTGDSFGHSSGNISYVAVFKTEDKAWAVYNTIKNQDWDEKHDLTYVSESGKEMTDGWACWSGYFESIENIEVKELIVE